MVYSPTTYDEKRWVSNTNLNLPAIQFHLLNDEYMQRET